MQQRLPSISEHDKRRIAVLAVCDPRTVDRLLRGLPVRPTSRVRIEHALVALGFYVATRVPR